MVVEGQQGVKGEGRGREGKGRGWLHASRGCLEGGDEGMVVLAISSPVRASWGGADAMIGILRTW